MILRIPKLTEAIRSVQEIQRKIIEPFAEIRARLSFPTTKTIQLPEIEIDEELPRQDAAIEETSDE